MLLLEVKGIDNFKNYFFKHSTLTNDVTSPRSSVLTLSIAKMKIKQHSWEESKCLSSQKLAAECDDYSQELFYIMAM